MSIQIYQGHLLGDLKQHLGNLNTAMCSQNAHSLILLEVSDLLLFSSELGGLKSYIVKGFRGHQADQQCCRGTSR